jgi:hypothetical protein
MKGSLVDIPGRHRKFVKIGRKMVTSPRNITRAKEGTFVQELATPLEKGT